MLSMIAGTENRDMADGFSPTLTRRDENHGDVPARSLPKLGSASPCRRGRKPPPGSLVVAVMTESFGTLLGTGHASEHESEASETPTSQPCTLGQAGQTRLPARCAGHTANGTVPQFVPSLHLWKWGAGGTGRRRRPDGLNLLGDPTRRTPKAACMALGFQWLDVQQAKHDQHLEATLAAHAAAMEAAKVSDILSPPDVLGEMKDIQCA